MVGGGETKIRWFCVDHDDEIIRTRSPPLYTEELVPGDYHCSGHLSDVDHMVFFVKLVMVFGGRSDDPRAIEKPSAHDSRSCFSVPRGKFRTQIETKLRCKIQRRNVICVAIICLYISYLYHRIHTSIASPSITTSRK